MKQPWQVFYDELWREIKRRGVKHDDGRINLSPDEMNAVWRDVSAATIEHLIHALHWARADADNLVLRLQAAYGDPKLGDAPRERLENAWIEWNLARRRRR